MARHKEVRRTTLTLPLESWTALEQLSDAIPGTTPNGLIVMAVEQMTPMLEELVSAAAALKAEKPQQALATLAALAGGFQSQMSVIRRGAHDAQRELDKAADKAALPADAAEDEGAA